MASNAVWNLIPFGLGFALNLVVVRVVVGRIGIEEFGLFGLLAVVLAPLTLANLGFGEATVKFVAEAARRSDLERAGRFVRTTLAMNVVVGLAGGLLIATVGPRFAMFAFDLAPESAPRVGVVLRAIALGWLANQVAAVFLAVPPAFQRFRLVAVGHGASQVMLAIGGVAGAVVGGLEGYAIGTALAAVAAAIVWSRIARRLLPGIPMHPAIDGEVWMQSFRFGSWQAVAHLGALVASQAERFLLGVFLSPAAVGFYNIAYGFEQRIYAAVFKMSEVLFPHFSAMGGDDESRQASQLLRASWLLTSLAVAALAPLIPLSEPLLIAWIPNEAAVASVPVLQTLAIAGILGCASNASFFFLLGLGETRGLALLSGVTGAVTIVVALVVLPRWGLSSAGVAAAAAMVGQQACLSTLLLRRRVGGALRLRGLLAALYAPVAAGLLVAALAFALGIPALRGWTALVVAYASLAAMTGVAIWGTSELLPGREVRRQDLRTVLASARLAFAERS